MDDCIRRQAAAFAADEGDDAVGAAGVAAVLYLESGAGVIPFSAEDGSGEKFGAVQDVAGEDLAEMGCSMLVPYKGMERNSRVRMKRGGGDKIVRRDGWGGAGKRID